MAGAFPDFSIFNEEFPQIAENGKDAIDNIDKDKFFSASLRLIIDEIIKKISYKNNIETEYKQFNEMVADVCNRGYLDEKWKRILRDYNRILSDDLHFSRKKFFLYKPQKKKEEILKKVYELGLEFARSYGKLDYDKILSAKSVPFETGYESANDIGKMSIKEHISSKVPFIHILKKKRKIVVVKKTVSADSVSVANNMPSENRSFQQPAFSVMQKMEKELLGFIDQKKNFWQNLGNDSQYENLKK